MLERYVVIDTPDAERMQAALSQTYGSRFFDLRGERHAFRGKANHAQLGGVGISYCFYGSQTEVNFPEADYVRLQISLEGAAETRIGNRRQTIFGDRSCIVPTDVDITTEFSEGYSQLVLRIEKELLEKRLSTLLGSRQKGVIKFDPVVNFSNSQAAALRRLVLFIAGELDHGIAEYKTIAAEIEQNLVTAFLCLNHHNFRTLLDGPPKVAAPWQVHRAEAYIEANWREPISIDLLCAEIGASARSIFAAFNKTRGYSPMAFLKSVRLRNARAVLERPEQRTSVTQTSLACGFQNLGHFAKDYRDAYGELPSETLARARSKI
jgi:AraC-like DNA-binding protein